MHLRDAAILLGIVPHAAVSGSGSCVRSARVTWCKNSWRHRSRPRFHRHAEDGVRDRAVAMLLAGLVAMVLSNAARGAQARRLRLGHHGSIRVHRRAAARLEEFLTLASGDSRVTRVSRRRRPGAGFAGYRYITTAPIPFASCWVRSTCSSSPCHFWSGSSS